MDNSKITIILALILGLIAGFAVGHFLFPKTNTEIITVYDSSKEEAKIDSLQSIVRAKEERIVELLDSAKHIKNVVIVEEIKTIEQLPLSDNVELLRDNLIKHGELTSETDSLPATIFDADTLTVLSENNVKDVNIIVAKYEGELKINNNLEEVINNQRAVVIQKDSIIDLKNSIILNQELGYTAEINGLEKSLKKEKVKKTVWISVLGTLSAVLGILAVSK